MNTIQRLRRTLSGRYRLKDHRHTAPDGRELLLTGVDDVETLLEALIAADSEDVRDERLPYWASLWPAAGSLANILLSEPVLDPSCTVLELGCGLGLCAVAASIQNVHLTVTDYQPDALLFTRLNCLQNAGQEPETALLDWRNPPAGRRYDILIGADLAYETRFFQPLQACFDTLLRPGGQILFSEPNRDIARPFFRSLVRAGWHTAILSDAGAATVYRITRG